MLMNALRDAGAILREPVIFHRSGIPGSGGPDWLRRDYEWVICATQKRGRLPWSDNTACGHPPKFKKGGEPTHRLQNGKRVRVRPGKGKAIKCGTSRGLNKQSVHKQVGSEVVEYQPYIPPKLANPGNVLKCAGGHLGDSIAYQNEAPFPEKLAEFFVKSFCPLGGIVMDCFGGSGTVSAVAEKTSRNSVFIDVRESQIELARQRLEGLGSGLVNVFKVVN